MMTYKPSKLGQPGLCMHDYKSTCTTRLQDTSAVVMICTTLVNIHTDT